MKTTTKVIKYILENSNVEQGYKNILSGDRQSGKTKTAIYESILRAIEENKKEYNVLVVIPLHSHRENILGMIREIRDNIPNCSISNYSVFHIGNDMKIEFSFITPDHELWGMDRFDFGILENSNYYDDFGKVLEMVLRHTKNFTLIVDTVLNEIKH